MYQWYKHSTQFYLMKGDVQIGLNIALPNFYSNVVLKDTMRWSWYAHFCFRYSMRLETFLWSSTTILCWKHTKKDGC